MKLNVICAQMHSVPGKKEENLSKMKDMIQRAAENTDILSVQTGARLPTLLIFPELALTGYECSDQYSRLAEPFPDGNSILQLAKEAKKNRVFLIFGFVEKAKKRNGCEVLYNSAAFIGADGSHIGCYRKSHLVQGEELRCFEKGKAYPVYDTPIGKIGIMICWDSAFPEVARILALNGAELIAVPAAWETPKERDWDLVQKARAFDNTIFVAACNHVGTDRTLTFFGRSQVVDPCGAVLCQANSQEELLSSTVDFSQLGSLRRGYYRLLADRNPDTYAEIIQTQINVFKKE